MTFLLQQLRNWIISKLPIEESPDQNFISANGQTIDLSQNSEYLSDIKKTFYTMKEIWAWYKCTHLQNGNYQIYLKEVKKDGINFIIYGETKDLDEYFSGQKDSSEKIKKPSITPVLPTQEPSSQIETSSQMAPNAPTAESQKITSKYFTEQQYLEFQSFSNMQETLFGITEGNKDEVIQFFQSFINSPQREQEFIHTLYNCVESRYTIFSILVDIATKLISQKKYFIKCAFTRVTDLIFICSFQIHLYFLRACLDCHFIEFSEILPEIISFINSTSDQSKFKQIYYIFAPEIDKNSDSSLDPITSLFSIEDKIIIQKDNYSTLQFSFVNGESDIEKAIKSDNVDELFHLIKKLNHSLDLNMKIPQSPIFYDYQPTLIEYAAFCGSINIIRFLVIQGASFSTKFSSVKYSLMYFAIAGGHNDAILFTRDINAFFEGILQISIIFHRFDVFAWILQDTNISIKDSVGSLGTPLFQTAQHNFIAATLLLLQCEIFEPQEDSIVAAIEANNFEVFYLLSLFGFKKANIMNHIGKIPDPTLKQRYKEICENLSKDFVFNLK